MAILHTYLVRKKWRLQFKMASDGIFAILTLQRKYLDFNSLLQRTLYLDLKPTGKIRWILFCPNRYLKIRTMENNGSFEVYGSWFVPISDLIVINLCNSIEQFYVFADTGMSRYFIEVGLWCWLSMLPKKKGGRLCSTRATQWEWYISDSSGSIA